MKNNMEKSISYKCEKEHHAFMRLLVGFDEAFRLLSLDLFHSREEYRNFYRLMEGLVKNRERQYKDIIGIYASPYLFGKCMSVYWEDYVFPLNTSPSDLRRIKSEEQNTRRILLSLVNDIYDLCKKCFPDALKAIKVMHEGDIAGIKEVFKRWPMHKCGTIKKRRESMRTQCGMIHSAFNDIIRLIFLAPEGEDYIEAERYHLMYPETCGRYEIDDQIEEHLRYRTDREQEGATYKDQIRREEQIKKRRPFNLKRLSNNIKHEAKQGNVNE